MATEGILQPGTPQSKPPLKRSTIIAVLVVVLAVLLIGALMRQAGSGQRKAPEADTRLNGVGSESAIDDEAKRVVVVDRVVPAPVRTDNTVALESSANTPPKEDPHAQLEAAGIVSRVMILDATSATSTDSNPVLDDAARQLAALNERTQSAQALALRADSGSRSGSETPPALQAALDQIQRNQMANASREQANTAWLKEYGKLPADASLKPKQVKGSYILGQGKVIPAILSRNINSDLPGEVTARVAVDVYDSYDGTHVLIPKGSELYGAYSSGVNVGQERLMFAFKRLMLPNRISFDLPAAKGMDLSGAAGVTGDVDNHFFKMFGTSVLFALMSVGVERKEPAPSGFGSPGGARTAAGQALVDVSRSILERNRTIPPTITVPAGTRINVQVAADMEFPAPYGALAR